MPRILLFETRTGNPIQEVDFVDEKWDTGILAADKLSFKIPAYTERSRNMGLRQTLQPRKVGAILQEDDGRTPVAGFLTAPPRAATSDDGLNSYEVTFYGPEKIIEDWGIRMYPGWPLVGADKMPTGAYDTRIEGVEYGTMMKRLIVEAMKFPGAELPLVFEPDRAGTRQNGWEAIDGKSVMEAIDDLAEYINGVEYDFVPRVDDLDQVSFEFRTGTDAIREISSAASATWRLGGEFPSIRGYERETSGDGLVDEAIFTGGKGDDGVVIERATTSVMIDQGFPRREVWDSSHSSVSDEATLRYWAEQAIAAGSGPVEFLTFEVLASKAVGLRHGDYCVIDSLDHWDMPDGEYERRILSVGSGASDDWRKIICMGEVIHE